MPTFKLNGQDIPFESGDTIMRAAWREGIEIPHYCWHPGLSIAANCRMCLVHIESGRQMAMPILKYDAKKDAYVPDTKPKLMPACQVEAQADMVVTSESEDVKNAQKHVQEFLLLNHPVDCPICDQAGECKLQDYYLEHHAAEKRKLTEPVHKPKGVRFGPTIVYDAERCIMCTRCIRVSDELAGDPVLDMRERGNRNEIVLSPGRELDHDYTLMTEHVCPVGALTSRDFRFKARVWFLKSAEGVCTGCARGCNTHVDYDHRSGKVFRLRPRDNMDVNRFWMCDSGMMTYQETHDARITTGVVGRGEDADPVIPEDAVADAAEMLKGVDGSKVALVFSAVHSSEDNQALARFAKLIGTDRLYLAARNAEKLGWKGDDILKHDDPNPNRSGAKAAAGAELQTTDDLVSDVLSGEVKAVVALGHVASADSAGLAALTKLDVCINLTASDGPFADVASAIVPVASWAETFGTFRNANGQDQSFQRAVPAPAGVEPGWRTIAAIAKAMGLELTYDRVADVRAEMAASAPA
ncbi:MAG: 2Fe-2S iron-sulfur cluster-binding protein [Myxococcota bacterium]